MRRTSLLPVLAILAFSSLAARADDVLIKTRDGATISAIVTLPDPRPADKMPTVLVFDIDTNPQHSPVATADVTARGYVSVVAYVRGKYKSPDAIVPYEHDGTDATAVIDWISKQPWSDGKVGMVGGSYSGFTAWAAANHRHPALKAIAVSASAMPGFGVPMRNNVFLVSNYDWTFQYTSNPLFDESRDGPNQHWFNLSRDWFTSGRPYREIDAVDGTPNPLLQRWLSHPDFDKYWQRMVPYDGDFAGIQIPVLSITGYYDDGQISALAYFKQHFAKRRQTEHYLVVGPYDHFGTHSKQKSAVLGDYAIDEAAKIDSQELKLQFLDYVIRGQPKPRLLVDRVNVEVMGSNRWRSAPSLEALHGIPMRLYLSQEQSEGLYTLSNRAPPSNSKVVHEVDLADRTKFHGFHAYLFPIVQKPLQYVTESMFMSQPFEAATSLVGSFDGELNFTVNKRDFDLSVMVYEARPDGSLFTLGYALQRASYAENPAKRKLLSPGKPTRLKFETTMTGRQMQPGSRLLVLVDVNKNPMAQVNYGTGKDVSDESIKDAGEPLKLEILSGSYIQVPLDNAIARK